jgi:hypothetical protein
LADAETTHLKALFGDVWASGAKSILRKSWKLSQVRFFTFETGGRLRKKKCF